MKAIKEIKAMIEISECSIADVWFKEPISVNGKLTEFIEVEAINIKKQDVVFALANTKEKVIMKKSFFNKVFKSTNDTIPF
jgi:3-deoxy-D-manno-octulosonic acid (KDO) 8-phosphate synthase